MARLKRVGSSPAVLVAVAALVAAVAGTAVADQATTAKKKDRLTKQEKKRVKKLADKRIAKAEPTLNVNSAKSADTASTADSATSATSANGVTPHSIAYTSSATATETTILDARGLQIVAACPGGDLTLVARSTVENAEIFYLGHETNSGTPPDSKAVDLEDLDPGEDESLLNVASPNAGDKDDEIIELIYQHIDGGARVTAQFTPDGPDDVTCGVQGHALAS
ncbi:MAG: hypothetical protein ACR2N5_00750 [Solirubrobacterales bacterium]